MILYCSQGENQAEALCFEAEKELGLVRDNISEEKQQNIKDIIDAVRQEIQSDNIDGLTSKLLELKTINSMRDLVDL